MRKIKIAQIGTSAYSHGSQVFDVLKEKSDIFEIVGYALPENEREKFPDFVKTFEDYKEMTVVEILQNPEIEAVFIETEEVYLSKYALMAAESKKQSEMLSKTVQALEGQVATGAVIKARGITLNAYNQSDKVTDRSSRVTYLLTTLSLGENDLAERGPVTVYIRVKDPDGILLVNDTQKTFQYNGEPMVCSASREVDYQGSEVEMGIYLNGIAGYVKGVYTIEAYTSASLLGTTELILR